MNDKDLLAKLKFIERMRESFPLIAVAIEKERVRQIKKHGDDDHHPDKFIRIMGEEVGEVCEAIEDWETAIRANAPGIQRNELLHMQTEIIQVAAVCVRMYESVERRLQTANEAISEAIDRESK